MNKEELKRNSFIALQKVSTNKYHSDYLKGFKNLAKLRDEMINGKFEDEEDDIVGVNSLDIPCYALHNQGFLKGYEAGLNDCEPNWISCADELPDPNLGKVLVYKTKMAVSIMEASVLKHSKKSETHWMPLPKYK
tara:strand:+ start:689 stop:1093 length:405 start_codon:yes stop_codon:yes gene_type:complete